MNKREKQRLTNKLRTYLESVGGQVIEEFSDAVGEVKTCRIIVPTLAGELQVTPFGNWVACRFREVGMALAVLGKSGRERLNKYSGKWNFSFYGPFWTVEHAVSYFRGEFERIAQKQEV